MSTHPFCIAFSFIFLHFQELTKVNLPCTPTKRPIIETSVKQGAYIILLPVFAGIRQLWNMINEHLIAEIVPFVMKDHPSFLCRLTKIRDDLVSRFFFVSFYIFLPSCKW
jgi:hypothetical protein